LVSVFACMQFDAAAPKCIFKRLLHYLYCWSKQSATARFLIRRLHEDHELTFSDDILADAIGRIGNEHGIPSSKAAFFWELFIIPSVFLEQHFAVCLAKKLLRNQVVLATTRRKCWRSLQAVGFGECEKEFNAAID
jgi:hypothetical protein